MSKLIISVRYTYIMQEGQNNYEPSSQVVARSLAGREVGKMKGVLGKLQSTKFEGKLLDDVHKAIGIRSSGEKSEKGEADKLNQEILSALAGIRQGEFEIKMSQAKDDKEKRIIQKHYAKALKPRKAELIINESGKKMNYTPLDSIHDIALVEKAVYDQIASGGSKKSVKDLATQVNKVMDRIGKNYLRGENIPGSIGEHFKDQAIKEVGKYVVDIRRKNLR